MKEAAVLEVTTGGRTCTHPGVDEEVPYNGDALLLPSAQAHVPLANKRRVPIGEGLDEPAAPTKGFERSKSAWRDDEETVRVGFTRCARDKPCASWGSR